MIVQQEKKYLNLFDIYKEFVFEWNLISDHIRWQRPVHLLFGDGTLYETGDHYCSRMNVEDFNNRIHSMFAMVKKDNCYHCEYPLYIQDSQVCKIREEGVIIPNKKGLPSKCQGRISTISHVMNLNSGVAELRELELLAKFPSKAMIIMNLKDMIEGKKFNKEKSAFVQLTLDKLPLIGMLFGLEAVNMIIEKIEQLLTKCVRNHDIIGRISGNSFGMILKSCEQQEIIVVAKRMVEMIEKSGIRPPTSKQSIGFSIGGTVIQPHEKGSPESIMYRAERALLDTQHIKKMAIPTAHVSNWLQKSKLEKGKRRREDLPQTSENPLEDSNPKKE